MKTILFINPDHNIREEAAHILKDEGYVSLFADNCRQGVEMTKRHLSELVMVILDINLLVEEGIEVYDRIKDINPNLPVVTTSTAGHYRPRLGAEKKPVKFCGGDVRFDAENN